MTIDFPILRSKITLPGQDGVLFRGRFLPIFEKIATARVTTITAGAGFGKSTLAIQACKHYDRYIAWYRLEKSDTDFSTFIQYVSTAFGISLESPLFLPDQQQTAIQGDRFRHALLSHLIHEIEKKIQTEAVFVFDDIQEISGANEIESSILFLLEHTPKNVHFILTGRTQPNIPLSKFRVNSELFELTETELRFSANEIALFFSLIQNTSFPGSSLNLLHDKTEGWIAGIILFYHSSMGKSPDEIEAMLHYLNSDIGIFSEYLGENAYEMLPEEIKSFLTRTSVLSQIEVDFCNDFLEINDADAILKNLEKKHLFTTSLQGEKNAFCYHNLFREFLLERLKTVNHFKTYTELNKKAAILYEKRGNIQEALDHYVQAKAFDDVLRILAEAGKTMIFCGMHNRIDKVLDALPRECFKRSPWPSILRSNLYTYSGDLNTSAAILNDVCSFYKDSTFKPEIEIALNDLGRIHYLAGDFEKALITFTHILENGVSTNNTAIEIYGHLIITHGYLGRFEEADSCYHKAMAELNHIHNDSYITLKTWVTLCWGFRFHFQGDFKRSLNVAESIYPDLIKLNQTPLLAYYYHLTSIALFLTGNFDESLKRAEKGIDIITHQGFQSTQVGWLLTITISIHVKRNQFDKAREEIDKGLSIFREGGSKWGEASLLVLNLFFYAKQKNIEQAISVGAQIKEMVSSMKLPWVEGKLYNIEAVINIQAGNYDLAMEKLDASDRVCGFSMYEHSINMFCRALCYYYKGDKEKALSMIAETLIIYIDMNYGAWSLFVNESSVEPLLELYNSGQFKEYIYQSFISYPTVTETLLESVIQRAPDSIRKAAETVIASFPHRKKRSALSICCLGRFHLVADGREIKSSHWKSKKALEIFKYLILARSRGFTPKEVLMELIWPEEAYEKSAKRLHVALPAIRKTLEPDVKRGESKYLIRDNDSYRIDIGQGGQVDMDRFESHSKKGLSEPDPKEALFHLLKAESYYKDDLFSEDLYAEWCYNERESLKNTYLSVLARLIEIYEAKKDYETCIFYAEQYLNKDLFAESVYRKIMQIYSLSGDNAMVIKTWKRCSKNIVDDLSCPLSDETVSLYHSLI